MTLKKARKVLISSGYGNGGWASWNSDWPYAARLFMLEDPWLVSKVEAGELTVEVLNGFKARLRERFSELGEKHFFAGGFANLKVTTVPAGMRYRLCEDNGCEWIEVVNPEHDDLY